MNVDRTEEKRLSKVAGHSPPTNPVRVLPEPNEAELRSRLAAVVESSDDAIISMDLETVIATWNSGAERMFGYRASEAIGQSITMLLPPGYEDEEPRIVQTLLGGKRVDHYETRRMRKDRTVLDVSLTVSPIYDAHRRIVGVSKILRDITERKRAQEAIYRTNERLAAILNSITDAFVTLDSEWRFTYLNPKAAQIFEQLGFAPAKVLERTYWHVFPAAVGTIVETEFQRALREHAAVSFENLYAPAGKWFEINAYPSSDAGLSVFFRDVTERKNNEAALRRRDEELRALADSIPQLAWMAEANGDIFWYNQRWFEYTGTTLEEMRGWGWKSVHDPDTLPSVVERWKLSLETGKPFEMEFPLRGADGLFRWFLTRVTPMRDSSGRVLRWFGTNTDVDEVRRAQQALGEESRILELLNDTGKSIASQLDLEKVVQTVTDSATQLVAAQFGAFFYNVLAPDGGSYLLFTLSGAPKSAFEHFGHPRATPLFGPTFRGEAPIRCDDVTQDPRYGQVAPHFGMPEGHLPVRSYLAVPVVSRNGEVIGGLFFGHSQAGVFTERSERLIVGVAAQAAIAIDNARLYEGAQREIAQRKKVEEALRHAQEELQHHAERLEEQVAERTAKLQETIQELESFSYSVSHDMRSPLRAMQGYSDVLLEDYRHNLDPAAVDYLTRIGRAASRMDLFIQDVLAYSRVAKGEIRLEPVDVKNVIRDVILNYPALHKEQADIQIVGDIPNVLGHEAYLTQVISNFLANAVKFVEKGRRPKVVVSAEISDESVRIDFTDNGIGIAPEHQKQIFQIFGRVYSEKKYEGTGIGLAIAKKAAERMGGSIGVESELGRGSRFHVRLKKA